MSKQCSDKHIYASTTLCDIRELASAKSSFIQSENSIWTDRDQWECTNLVVQFSVSSQNFTGEIFGHNSQYQLLHSNIGRLYLENRRWFSKLTIRILNFGCNNLRRILQSCQRTWKTLVTILFVYISKF